MHETLTVSKHMHGNMCGHPHTQMFMSPACFPYYMQDGLNHDSVCCQGLPNPIAFRATLNLNCQHYYFLRIFNALESTMYTSSPRITTWKPQSWDDLHYGVCLVAPYAFHSPSRSTTLKETPRKSRLPSGLYHSYAGTYKHGHTMVCNGSYGMQSCESMVTSICPTAPN